jgi:16S rRNA (adenine1518-N6/adenine1519-N6)-dimethyltransferase
MARRLNVRTILARHGLKPKSSWSQNFLVDLDVIEDIVEAAGVDGKSVVELGAGFGALTALLAKRARKVVAVERDRDFARLLRDEFAGDPKVEILEANAAGLEWESLCARLGGRPVVVGNLPYHMATPILFHLLDFSEHLEQWVLMFQKEMADRILADPGSRAYGVLTVMVQRWVRIEPVRDVNPSAFVPSPKVTSSVVRFRRRKTPLVQVRDEGTFTRVVRGTFGQRRKKIRNSLMAALGKELDAQAVDRALELAEVDASQRPEQLAIESFGRLADVVFGLLQEKGGVADQ